MTNPATAEALVLSTPESLENGQNVGRTVLELLAQPVASYGEMQAQGPHPLRSTPTQRRTFDQQAQRPDSVPDISQE